MGTRFELVLDGLDGPMLRAAGEEAIDEIHHWHDRLSAFSPGSQLNHIARAAPGRAVALDDDLFELFSTAVEVARLTGGALDITLGPLMRAYGLRANGGRTGTSREPIDAARARTGMGLVELDGHRRTIRLHAQDMELDLGAIAKGFAIDRAGSVLREAGVACALVHGGTSSVLAIGAPPGESCWRIAIADPSRAEPDDPPSAGLALLRDAALGVSAPSGRMVEHEGRRVGHVLDPRTGEPARSAALAGVVAPTALLADAWSTALLVLGDAGDRIPPELDAMVVSASGPMPTSPRVLTSPRCEESAA